MSMALKCSLGFLAMCSLLDVANACFASGICGGGCAPPPPAPVCMGGCGGGYACGRYGCYRARARGSKTLALVEETSSNTKDLTPDEKFMKCCEDRHLPDSCLSKCSFRTFTKAALQAMYFKQDSCPMQAAADMQYCAAQGRDHTDCCARNSVGTTLAGDKCFTFCDQRPGNVTQLDFSYLACYDRFENMKACFWQDIVQRSAPSFSFNNDNEFPEEQAAPRSFALTGSRTFQVAKTFGQ